MFAGEEVKVFGCTARDYGRELHDFLNKLSPDCPVKLYDNNGNKLFDGYAGEITETIMFSGWKVDTHCFHNEMIIWIF